MRLESSVDSSNLISIGLKVESSLKHLLWNTMMMKRNLEGKEIRGIINAHADIRKAMATSLKNQMIRRAMVIIKRKAITIEISERVRKKSPTKTSEITKPNSTDVEINLHLALA